MTSEIAVNRFESGMRESWKIVPDVNRIINAGNAF